jgi:hypothetical protein
MAGREPLPMPSKPTPRIAAIRRRVALGTVVAFLSVWLVVLTLGKGGLSASPASTSTTAATSAPATTSTTTSTTTDSSATESSPSADSSQDEPPSLDTSQS